MKKLLIAVCLMLLPCVALANGWGTLCEPPAEVLAHIASRWPAYELEDYCEIDDTPKGDYGFALLKSNEERLLVGYHKEDGKMKYWLKNAGAVPQEFDNAVFFPYRKGETLYDTRDDSTYSAENGGFSVGAYNPVYGEEADYQVWMHYAWIEEGFHLANFSQMYDVTFYIEGNYIEMWDWSEKEPAIMYGIIQTDIRNVSYNTLPKTIEEAYQTVPSASKPSQSGFYPREIKFRGGQRYPVYTGPGEEYVRSGNGKGMVSTNDWIQVLGSYGNWIMIHYEINAEQYRVGWIAKDALPKGAEVTELDIYWGIYQEKYAQDVVETCFLTDDPFNSRKAIAKLEKGTPLKELIYDYEGWSYILVEVDGQIMGGFVPTESISHG